MPDLIGMDEFPQGFGPNRIDPSKISDLLVFVEASSEAHVFEVGSIKATGRYQPKPWEQMASEAFFPFVDEFGQFKHADWPGKVKNVHELHQQKLQESKALAAQPRPVDWNQYGGWIDGPHRTATGHFRVEKVDGKWWLIDPDGALFWSHGIDVVRNSENTVITERERYFERLPLTWEPLGKFYGDLDENQVSRGYYLGKTGLTGFDFAKANQYKKYGPNWSEDSGDIVHKRLSSWGINTMGLWSAPELTSMGRTPYVDWNFYRPPVILGESENRISII